MFWDWFLVGVDVGDVGDDFMKLYLLIGCKGGIGLGLNFSLLVLDWCLFLFFVVEIFIVILIFFWLIRGVYYNCIVSI